MATRAFAVGDLDWVVAVLTRRRDLLVAQAPVFWRPAPDAAERHRKFLEYLLTEAGAFGYRTDDALLIAVPRGDGWLIDDAHVRDEQWLGADGAALWRALAVDVSGDGVRFVCPTHERVRAQFARENGLNLAESWWLLELDGPGGGQGGLRIDLPGAAAETVEAPSVYAPPGPVLFLPAPADVMPALATAIEEAPRLGCPAIVVSQMAHDTALAGELTQAVPPALRLLHRHPSEPTYANRRSVVLRLRGLRAGVDLCGRFAMIQPGSALNVCRVMTADFTLEDSGDLLLRLGPMDGSDTELVCGPDGPERWVGLVLDDQGKLVALRMRAVADLLVASFLTTGGYDVDLDTDEDVVDLSFGAPAMTARSVECALPETTGEVVLYFDRASRLGAVSIFQASDALHLGPEANDTQPDERRVTVPLPAPSQVEPPLEEQGLVAQVSAILF